jgi:hypothetical protein
LIIHTLEKTVPPILPIVYVKNKRGKERKRKRERERERENLEGYG